ncbi:hypothetical protein ABZP36_003543 [Zizania latifolia]
MSGSHECGDKETVCESKKDVRTHPIVALRGDEGRVAYKMTRWSRATFLEKHPIRKGSPLGFKDLEWLDDIDLFHVTSPAKRGSTAPEVPEFFALLQPTTNVGLYKTSKVRQSKKPRVEMPDDDEDFSSFLILDEMLHDLQVM